MVDKLRYKLDLQMFASGDPVGTVDALELTINFDENITKVEAANFRQQVFATWNTSGQVVIIDKPSVYFNVSLKDGYVLNEITLGDDITHYGGLLNPLTDKSFNVQFGTFTSAGGTITLTSKPTTGGGK